MIYRAVGNRCAVDFRALDLPILRDEAIAVLREKGFHPLAIDLVALARTYVGNALYRRGARLAEAPVFFDCSSMVKWLYGQAGVWLPRRSIQQRERGVPVELHECARGDIIFMSGCIDYYLTDPMDGVGHVGITTGEGTIIHAANSRQGIIENSVDDFLGCGATFRGARRLIPRREKDDAIVTFITPPEREVETSDDIRWIVLQSIEIAHQERSKRK